MAESGPRMRRGKGGWHVIGTNKRCREETGRLEKRNGDLPAACRSYAMPVATMISEKRTLLTPLAWCGKVQSPLQCYRLCAMPRTSFDGVRLPDPSVYQTRKLFRRCFIRFHFFDSSTTITPLLYLGGAFGPPAAPAAGLTTFLPSLLNRTRGGGARLRRPSRERTLRSLDQSMFFTLSTVSSLDSRLGSLPISSQYLNLPNDLSVDSAADAVLQLEVHLGHAVLGEDRGIGDITDGGALDHVADGESLDCLVLGCAARAVGAADRLHMATALLVASATKLLVSICYWRSWRVSGGDRTWTLAS